MLAILEGVLMFLRNGTKVRQQGRRAMPQFAGLNLMSWLAAN